MHTTMDLLGKALNERNMSQAEWCRQLQMNRTALAVSKVRGRLSPTVAGNLARLLGEPVEHWIAVAALEAEPASPAKMTLITKALKWSLSFKKFIKHRTRARNRRS